MSQIAAPSPLDAVLRHVCRQAADPALPLAAALILYRAVIGLARVARQTRADAGLPRGADPDLIALLGSVLAGACQRALDPGSMLPMAAHLLRVTQGLAQAVRLASPVAPIRQHEPDTRPKPRDKAATPAPTPTPTPVPVSRPAPRSVIAAAPLLRRPIPARDQALIDAFVAKATASGIKDYKVAGVSRSALSPLPRHA